MKLIDINSNSISKVSNKELLNMHYRCHQQYILAQKYHNKPLMSLAYKAHSIIIREMKKRHLNHQSPLKI